MVVILYLELYHYVVHLKLYVNYISKKNLSLGIYWLKLRNIVMSF